MPITFKQGDLFVEPVEALVNAVNTQGRMGAGIALEFAKRYPDMFQDYKRVCAAGELKPGVLHMFQETGKLIINFPTKDLIYQGSNLHFITIGVQALRSFLQEKVQGPYPVPGSIAIPALGCGYGGLGWDSVKSILETYLKDCSQDIRIFEPQEECIRVRFDS